MDNDDTTAVINIKSATKRRLMRHMATPESWDEAINRILDEVEGIKVEEIENG